MHVRIVMTALLAGTAAAGGAQTREAATFERDFGAFVDRLRAGPYAPPGFVVVAFDRDGTVFERAYGVRNLETRAPMTLDTPVYNASLTKAYTGLLASMLHEEGVLPLETTLKQVWPGITLRAPLDPDKVTAARLLSHSSGMFDGGLQYLSNTTGEVTPAEAPAHLAAYAEPTAAFRYSNFGPFVYSTMAATRTGSSWRQLIEQRVFAPLALKATTARIESRPRGELAHCNTYAGGKWNRVPLKPTPILNAAGGIYASARDTSRFIRAFVTDGRSVGGRIAPSVWRRTWQRVSDQAVDFHGLQRDSYGLGWDLGAYEGERYVSRAGGYTGCRSYALFLPERGFGVAILTAGDVAANLFNVSVMKQAVDLWTGAAAAPARGDARIAEFNAAAATQVAGLQAIDPRIARPAALDRLTAAAAPGTYVNPRIGRMVVTRGPHGLVARSGALVLDVVPVSVDRSLFVQRGEYEPLQVRWIGDPKARFTAVEWDGDRFERVR